jgi:hypothetical protein
MTHTSFAVVPEIVRGSQTYVDAPRSEETHRSPMYLLSISSFIRLKKCARRRKYITTPLIETTSVVCELNVFDPAVAKSCHADHGPAKLVAVQYILSFGAVLSSQFVKHDSSSNRLYGTVHTPAALVRGEHKVSVSTLVYCRGFVILCEEIGGGVNG